ncbi:response regulator [Aeromicrobium phragmitis]|uniref:response regulator n=1 Tax=Aeromicrobium phragmitis TaxID=2478914 RepID=UPI0010617E84|nr:response regulator transcription factor [Aeromicrobium phragmitis]
MTSASSRREDSPAAADRSADHVTVLMVDDHPVVLRGLREICASDPGLVVVGEASVEEEALRATNDLRPDVVVLPIRLGGTRGGIELCRSIKSLGISRVVVFTSFTRTVDAQVALLAGADAVVSKSASVDVVLQALREAGAGRSTFYLGSASAPHLEASALLPFEPLTEREQEILELVLEGLTNTAISERLVIELSTVKTHMRSVLRKLGVGTRRDLL